MILGLSRVWAVVPPLTTKGREMDEARYDGNRDVDNPFVHSEMWFN